MNPSTWMCNFLYKYNYYSFFKVKQCSFLVWCLDSRSPCPDIADFYFKISKCGHTSRITWYWAVIVIFYHKILIIDFSIGWMITFSPFLVDIDETIWHLSGKLINISSDCNFGLVKFHIINAKLNGIYDVMFHFRTYQIAGLIITMTINVNPDIFTKVKENQ